MTQRILDVANNLNAAREKYQDAIAMIENQFSELATMPTSLPLYRLRDYESRSARTPRFPKGCLQPVAWLTFDGEKLIFREEPKRFIAEGLPSCCRCGTLCETCELRQVRRRQLWQQREAKRVLPVEVMYIEESAVLKPIMALLPVMRDRLIADSKISIEEIDAAIADVHAFIASTKPQARV